jgi:hypothetical protein
MSEPPCKAGVMVQVRLRRVRLIPFLVTIPEDRDGVPRKTNPRARFARGDLLTCVIASKFITPSNPER